MVRALRQAMFPRGGLSGNVEGRERSTMVMPHTIPLSHASRQRSEPRRLPALPDAIAYADRWTLLHPTERRALTQLAVFRGGWTLEAAQSTLSLELGIDQQSPFRSVLDVIEALLDKSMIRVLESAHQWSTRRFEIHPSVAQIAQLELETSVESDDIYERHAAYILHSFGDALASSFDLEYRSRLDDEGDNLHAVYSRSTQGSRTRCDRALQALVALAPIYERGGSADVYSSMFERALGDSTRHTLCHQQLLCEALIACGKVEVESGHFKRAVERYTQARDLATTHSLSDYLVISLVELAEALWYLRRQQEATEHLRRARELSGDYAKLAIKGRLEAAHGLCSLWSSPVCAERHLERALLLFRDLGDEPRVAQVLARLALARFIVGRVDVSEHCAQDALEAAERVDDPRRAVEMQVLIALIAKERGQTIQAERTLTHLLSLDQAREIGVVRAVVLLALAEVHLERGSSTDAAKEFLEGFELAKAMSAHDAALWALCGLGRSEAELDHPERAREWFEEATKWSTTTEGLTADPIVGLCKGHLDLARARSSIRSFDIPRARACLDAVRSRLSCATDTGESAVTPSNRIAQIRIPLGLLERRIVNETRKVEAGLRIGHEGRWFSVGLGERVKLEKRLRPRRLLMALVEHRARDSDHGIDLDDLFHAVWPDEIATPKSAANRVYVTITRLRKLGLGDVLKCSERGFFLDPQVPLIVDEYIAVSEASSTPEVERICHDF